MNRAMAAAASGMAAQQTVLEIVADDLANADVAGYKASAATFADVRAGAVGLGTQLAGRHAVFAQGKLVKSEGAFDLAIDGPGFFHVRKEGIDAYTRDGEFVRAPDGMLRTASGWTLADVRIPADALAARVARDGRVTIDTAAKHDVAVGRIGLSAFPAPEGLESLGGTLFAASARSGAPHRVMPGKPGGPSLAFGQLERANVTIVESMMRILGAQRAYEANAKGVQAADEMLRIANNLQRG